MFKKKKKNNWHNKFDPKDYKQKYRRPFLARWCEKIGRLLLSISGGNVPKKTIGSLYPYDDIKPNKYICRKCKEEYTLGVNPRYSNYTCMDCTMRKALEKLNGEKEESTIC